MANRKLSDFMASIVVFLVALPLCMGIAIACGVPVEKGIITGIVGGLVVGALGGSPLQVSGPAAGLVVLVWQIVTDYGLPGLGVAVFLAGVLQLIAGQCGLGRWFRSISPTVIHGMLSGIGVLIFASQFHVMLDHAPDSDGITNLLGIPSAILDILQTPSSVHFMAGAIGVFTILLVAGWEAFKPKKLRVIPGALLGIVAAACAAQIAGFEGNYVAIPTALFSSDSWISLSSFSIFLQPAAIALIFSLALVASAETLLCAAAVDKMKRGHRTDYNKELTAQGIGNIVCGFFTALPMTGVIVRSSANVQAGGQTRLSAFLHGAWLLVFILALPAVLELIPTASLAALLVFIGYKLINIKILKELKTKGPEEPLIFILTVLSIVAFDLLTGILIGFVATLLQLLYRLTHLDLSMTYDEEEGEYSMNLSGAASFLSLPLLAEKLEQLPDNAVLHVHLRDLKYIDHACLELLVTWGDQHKSSGGEVFIEWDALHHYLSKSMNRNASVPDQGLLDQQKADKELAAQSAI